MRHFRASLHSIHFMRTFDIQAKYKEPFNSRAFFPLPCVPHRQSTALPEHIADQCLLQTNQFEDIHFTAVWILAHAQTCILAIRSAQTELCMHTPSTSFLCTWHFSFSFWIAFTPRAWSLFCQTWGSFCWICEWISLLQICLVEKICHSILQDSNSISAHTTDVVPVS